jgi:hypothetical protein
LCESRTLPELMNPRFRKELGVLCLLLRIE